MYPEDVSPSLGHQIVFPWLMILLALLVFISVASACIHVFGESYGEWGLGALISFLLAAGLAGGIAWGMYPYDSEYHTWRTKAGVVQSVSSRLMGDQAEKFVVVLDDGQAYGIQDTRASLIKAGDTVVLRCKRAWQYAGTDGWDCAYKNRIPK